MQKLKWENIHGEIFGLTFCDYAKSFCDLMNEYAKDCLSKWPSSDVSIRLHFLFDYKTSTENNFNDFYVLNKMTSECNNMGDCAIAISLHDKGFSINHEAELIIENLDKIPQKLSHAALADDKYFGCYIEFKNFDVPDQIKKIFNLFNEQLLPIFCSGFSGGPLEDVINYMLSLGLSDRTVPNLLRGNRENLYRSVNKEFIARYFLLDSDYLNTLSSMKYEHGANKGCVVIQSQDEYVLNHQQEFLVYRSVKVLSVSS